MTSKKPRTGGEIDSWCTKCRLDLTHRIIAMVGDVVKKVECKTCGSHHLYRPPKSDRDRKVQARAAASPRPAEGRPSVTAGKSGGERLTAAQRTERDQTAAWEHAIAGRPSGAFKPYRITLVLCEGELIHHSKFGDGVVSKVIDQSKVEILFKDGPKTMAHGQQVAS